MHFSTRYFGKKFFFYFYFIISSLISTMNLPSIYKFLVVLSYFSVESLDYLTCKSPFTSRTGNCTGIEDCAGTTLSTCLSCRSTCLSYICCVTSDSTCRTYPMDNVYNFFIKNFGDTIRIKAIYGYVFYALSEGNFRTCRSKAAYLAQITTASNGFKDFEYIWRDFSQYLESKYKPRGFPVKSEND